MFIPIMTVLNLCNNLFLRRETVEKKFNSRYSMHQCVCVISRLPQSLVYIYSSFTAAPCQALAPIPNGAITYGPDTIASFNVDTVATHTCDPGFIRVFGSETRVCSAGRRWSGLIPVCQGIYARFVL